METLQLAQMLADLSDLNAADPRAAHALVNANATIATTAATASSTPVHQTAHDATAVEGGAASSAEQTPANRPQHRRVASSSALAPGGSGAGPVPRTTGTSTPFDSYLGRRLMTPPITRSSSSHGSMPGTPRGNETDSDVDRASSLMALYELRAKLKQYNDSNSLRQAREKVAALSARQPHQPQQQQQQQQSPLHPSDHTAESTAALSTSPPQPPSMARRHSQYTYPRS